MDLSAGAAVFLGACVFFAGVVDALAGGGGLITLPAYLAVGLNPALVLGTNKLTSSIGTIVSTARYHHALKFSIRDFLPVIAASTIGSWLGGILFELTGGYGLAFSVAIIQLLAGALVSLAIDEQARCVPRWSLASGVRS